MINRPHESIPLATIPFLLLCLLLSAPQTTNAQNATPKKNTRKTISEINVMVATWKEPSVLSRSDGTDYTIKTLNNVIRIGTLKPLRDKNNFLRYGILMGQSENAGSIDSDFLLQRSVLLAGLEVNFGRKVIINENAELGLSFGGIFRNIQHSNPPGPYKFSTATRILPLFLLDLRWELMPSLTWVQNIGTMAMTDDTFWSTGLSWRL